MVYVFFIFGFIFLIVGVYLVRKPSSHGEIVIKYQPDGKRIFSLEIGIDPDEIENMKVVVFKVVKEKIAD